jgi:hypothetical protein
MAHPADELTALGQLPFFIHFLKAPWLLDAFVADCPLRYSSPKAPKKRDVLGTTMWSSGLTGRCSPVTSATPLSRLRCDVVLPEVLGMENIVSEDAVSAPSRRSTRKKARTW